ncbi:MAG: hypothetical protein GF416_04805 [Candidatus Altiarchaeales archaeon]|nr:hypothetical protein [Candidatus Altiarchaeales archaeon]MBD3416440.1 hypothetical protein [Candidatus Altiarchaeales archaeon]
MDGKTKLFAAGLAALLVLGLVVAVNATEAAGGSKGFSRHGFMKGHEPVNLEELGLTEDATREEIREAMWEKRLSDLGLTEDDTIGEFHIAVKARMEERHQEMEERHSEMLSKLGLGEDATHEEIMEAHHAYCQENPDKCPGKMGGGFPGRGMRGGGCPFAEGQPAGTKQ